MACSHHQSELKLATPHSRFFLVQSLCYHYADPTKATLHLLCVQAAFSSMIGQIPVVLHLNWLTQIGMSFSFSLQLK